MKRSILFLALLFSFDLGFSQAVFPNADSVGNYLKGGWKWLWSTSLLQSPPITPTTAGYAPKSIIFNKVQGSPDSLEYTWLTNGNLTAGGRARISYSPSINGGTWVLKPVQLYPPGFSDVIAIYLAKPDSVWFHEICGVICPGHVYTRDTAIHVGLQKFRQEGPGLRLFPNPSSNNIQLSIPDGLLPQGVRIADALGKTHPVSLAPDQSVDISGLPPGIYTLCLETDQGSVTARFLKQ